MADAVLQPGDLNVRIVGDQAPTLLFVHGFCCAMQDWFPAMDLLSAEFRCAALDLPGHGRSVKDTPATMATVADAVNLAKDATGSGAVVLIGHSLGAKVVREAYRRSRRRVAGVVLVDGSYYVADRDTMRANTQRALADGMEPFVRGIFTGMFTDAADPALATQALARALAVDGAFARDLLLDSIDWDARLALDTIRGLCVPTLVLQTTAFDSNFGRHAIRHTDRTPIMDKVAELVPDPETVVMEEAGHFPMLEKPADFAAIIARFARRAAALW